MYSVCSASMRPQDLSPALHRTGIVVGTGNASTGREVERSGVQGCPWLHSEFEAIAWAMPKNKTTKTEVGNVCGRHRI